MMIEARLLTTRNEASAPGSDEPGPLVALDIAAQTSESQSYYVFDEQPTNRIAFGCDYNPEQWSPDVWAEDVKLMRVAGVNVVALNIFGWAQLEKRRGEYDFSALDSVIDLLHSHGISVNLGTGTSSPPPWLTREQPEILPMAADGTRRWPGGRQAWCPSSPVFRERALALVQRVAERYGNHPAVRLWHVSNELGCHNALCYCDVSAASFRRWLERRYGTIDALNAAWGTAFWSQHYTEWVDILPPRLTLSMANPTQSLDFSRFSSDEVLDYYLAEARVVREHSAVPVTTNFMVTAHIRTQDYWSWAPHVDIVANDHYLDHRLDSPHQELSFAADLTRGLSSGRPWILMESSTGSVNWQPRNFAKAPGEMIRNSLAHVARGADGVCFFQWRASAHGSEKFHSGMLPHSGTATNTWREVLELSRVLGAIRGVAGTQVVAEVALVFSWDAWWSVDVESQPSCDVRYLDQVHRIYRALWESGITVDVVPPGADLASYRFVVVPCLYMVTDDAAQVLDDYVSGGGHALVTFFSGIVDEFDRIRLGGYPGAFTRMLGITTEEFFPLAAGAGVGLDDGSTAHTWTEWINLDTAEPIASFTDGTLSGRPAITRNEHGQGVAWYLGTELEHEALVRQLGVALHESGIDPPTANAGLEVVRRRSSDSDFVFLLNHTEDDVTYPITGFELTIGEEVHAAVVPAGAVRVVREAPASENSVSPEMSIFEEPT